MRHPITIRAPCYIKLKDLHRFFTTARYAYRTYCHNINHDLRTPATQMCFQIFFSLKWETEDTWICFGPSLTQVTYYLLTGNLLTFSLRSGELLSLSIRRQEGREKVAQVWHICSGVTGVIEMAVSVSLVVKVKSARSVTFR